MQKYILSLDSGTTSNRCIIYNTKAEIVSIFQEQLQQYFTKDGYVEEDPDEIYSTMVSCIKGAVLKANINIKDIIGVGITNQRETVIVWDKKTGVPIYNAIVWQCRRTTSLCKKLKDEGIEREITKKTGLLLDPYFSATKIKWILDNVEGARERAENGDLLFGTVDTWLMWKLTEGKVHATDYTNASRTLMFNINTLSWDKDLLKLFDIPLSMLPKVYPSSYNFGFCNKSILEVEFPILSAIGDQQSSLFGQRCFNSGDAKVTYGTGGFILMNIGEKLKLSKDGLLTTIAWGLDNKVVYAQEGSIFAAGSIVKWLINNSGLVSDVNELEQLCTSVESTDNVYFIPAFTGIGAPYWKPNLKATFTGITFASQRSHIVRSCLESIIYLTSDIIETIKTNSKIDISKIYSDGGMSVNDFIMQFQSDILLCDVYRGINNESTSLGACLLAGITSGVWKGKEEISLLNFESKKFTPQMDIKKRNNLVKGWKTAIEKTINGECNAL